MLKLFHDENIYYQQFLLAFVLLFFLSLVILALVSSSCPCYIMMVSLLQGTES